MSIFLRVLVLGVLLVAAVGCGEGQQANLQSAPRSCGIEGLFATLNEATTLTFQLPDAEDDARPRITAVWVRDSRTPIEFPRDFNPIDSKEISVLPSENDGETDLSVRFGLAPLTEEYLDAILATPGEMQLTVQFSTAAGQDTCTIDVGLLPPSL